VRDPRQTTSVDETALHRQIDDLDPPSRWSAATSLDAFWPVLAVVLVCAVIFVASVAHSSMDSVGVPVSKISAQPPKPTSASTAIWIVQVSSHTTRSAAQAASEELVGRGYKPHILNSSNYRPLNRGYYVVYLGPYPATAEGRTDARRQQAKLPDALLRDVHPR
jgi:sporulation related protein